MLIDPAMGITVASDRLGDGLTIINQSPCSCVHVDQVVIYILYLYIISLYILFYILLNSQPTALCIGVLAWHVRLSLKRSLKYVAFSLRHEPTKSVCVCDTASLSVCPWVEALQEEVVGPSSKAEEAQDGCR